MDESEENMSAEDVKSVDSPLTVKTKPKKRSLIERELETNLTARVTSPVTNSEGLSTSRYGRARRLKTESENPDKKSVDVKSPVTDKSPLISQSPVYKMHASNSPMRVESPQNPPETCLEDQIENIYQENISLSRFGTEEVTNQSPGKKYPKVYIRKDLIQKREAEETITLIKNMFSPVKSDKKNSNSHLNNILERSSERFTLSSECKPLNGFIDNSSVVKTLDFDSKRKKKENRDSKIPSKSELFDLEAKCAYQVGDLAWARMGTFPFWPCIVTRDPAHGIFVKKKLFGRIERDVIHVTFFGDNGRRGWIVDTMLRKYLGQLEFETTRENFTPEDKKKDPRLYAAFFVSEKKQALWNTSVEEAEMLLREPKRLRIDIFNDMLEKTRGRVRPNKSGKICRTDSDVSLSESLYDSLFSEDDGKTDNAERARNRSRNKSLDVFDVVTACLDNMAAKTGITKIQKQSHMDRWLQKAKSKTPEKIQVTAQKEVKVSSKKKKKTPSKGVRVQNPYSLRKSTYESQHLLPFQNEHDYSKALQYVTDDSEDTDCHNSVETGSGVKCKVEESLSEKCEKSRQIVNDEDSTDLEETLNDKHENPQQVANDESSTDLDDSQDIANGTETRDSTEDVKIESNKASVEYKDSNQLVSTDTKQLYESIESKKGVEEPNESDGSNSKLSEVNKKTDDTTDVDSTQLDTSVGQGDDLQNNKVDESNMMIEAADSFSNKQPNDKDDTGCQTFETQPKEDSIENCSKDHDTISAENLEIAEETFTKEVEAVSQVNKEMVYNLETEEKLFKDDKEVSQVIEDNKHDLQTSKAEDIIDNADVSKTPAEQNDMSLDYDSDSDIHLPYSPLSVDLNKDKPTLEDMQMDQDLDGFEELEMTSDKLKDSEFNCGISSKSCLNNNLNSVEDCKNKICDFDKNGHFVYDRYDKSKITETDRDISNLREKHFSGNHKEYTSNEANITDNENISNHKGMDGNNIKLSTTSEDQQQLYTHSSNEFDAVGIPKKNSHDWKDSHKSDKTNRNTDAENKTKNRISSNKEIDKEISDRYLGIETRPYNDKRKDKNIPETLKENGYHDCDFDVETASIHSEDSVASSKSDNKRKLRSMVKKVENPLDNPEFVAYMELRQDAIMDEYPELSQEEILAYLHKTWLYEQSLKSDTKKNDDLRESNLVKGLTKDPSKTVRKKNLSLNRNNKVNSIQTKKESNFNPIETNSTKEKKKYKRIISQENSSQFIIKEEDVSNGNNISEESNTITLNDDSLKNSVGNVKSEIDSPVETNLDDCSIVQTRTELSTTQLDGVKDSKEASSINEPNVDTISLDSCNNTKDTERVHIPDNTDIITSHSEDVVLNNPNEPTDIEVKKEIIQEKYDECNYDVESTGSAIHRVKDEKDSDFNFDAESIDSEDSEAPLIKCKLRSMKSDSKERDAKVKNEVDPDVVSIYSEDSEVSVGRRKKKKAEKDLGDPEFVKYMELRQDALIDENPQLTQEEIVTYLYQTWLYEENTKSDLKKTEEIEQAGIVKGLNDNAQQPKKVKRKIKTEKETVDSEITIKDKPKRKATKPYYNEEYSDIEEEIAFFEIFNTKHKEISKTQTDQIIDVDKKDITLDIKEELMQKCVDVELYFEDLTRPKPNIFKGLVREKVCEICEKTVNLVKCKGCNGMFHPVCVEKESKRVEVQPPTRGRKKKKKYPRKAKGMDDSETPDDGSEDQNGSIEEIIEIESQTIDASIADAFEEKFTAKMMELIDTTPQYDSYSSDDGLDWTDTVPGKCEIIDIKPRLTHSQIDFSDFKCNNCTKYDTPVCFVCKSAASKTDCLIRQKCHVAHCHKYYHLECLDHWPQTQFNGGEPSKSNKKINEYFEALTCPRHVCHTCVSDDPRGCKTRFSGDKLARCVRCPATYHSFTKCLPAGTQILTASHIVCPRHYENTPGKVRCHVNTGWCFICALGGSLICCEYCPTSFHAECLNIKPPEGGYMCEDCETGRLPLYGEMVWVKLGHYRWWPGIILHPSEIPENILAVKHWPGEFAVRFFGQYDYYWVNRGRVFPFQEGDSGRISSQKSKIDAAFTTAMEHAQRACEILKTAQPNDEESLDIASSLLPPHYVKLKVNRPCGSLCGRRLEDPESSLTQCECNPLDEDPCGPYSQCLNRVLLTECGPTCRAGDRCNNRAFEKRLYPKLVPYRTPARGWGLKTLEDIKAGQFVIEYVGELIDEEEFKRRMRRMHEMRDENFYFLTLDKERMIDAGPKGNLARFMNHCCEPNCETQKWTVLGDVRVGLFALNDIPANSEVTFNYNLECAGIEKKRCMCGAKRCSGYIGAKPKQDEPQTKKNKLPGKRTYKKRKNPEESPSTNKDKPKRPIGRPPKPKELSEIEKDLLIIKNATNGLSSDESSRSLSSDYDRNPKALKRKRVSFSTEEIILYNGLESPSVKKHKLDVDNSVGD